jgi:deleted-in-malignant-brain-tumors protein 1
LLFHYKLHAKLAGASAISSESIIDGTGRIWLDQVQCSGNEISLFACPAILLGEHINNCEHSDDAGVRCIGTTFCSQGAIRLLDGSTTTEGRVEICNNNAWGTVCNDLWDNVDAEIACKQLGLPSSGNYQ